MGLVLLAHCGDKSTSSNDIDNRNYEMSYLREYQYLERTYYHVGKTDRDSVDIHFNPGVDKIVSFKLFVPGSPEVQGDMYALITIDPRNKNAYPKNQFYAVVHQLTEGEDFFLEPDEFYIRLNTSLARNQFLACAMVVETPTGGIIVGEYGTEPGSNRILKMLRPTAMYPGSPTWDYEWRNVYDLGVTGFAPGDVKVDICMGPRGTEGADSNLNHQDGIPYLQFFGLDRSNNAGQGGPDGRIDCIAGTVDRDLGHIFFPNCQPFDPRPDTCYSPAGPLVKRDVKFPELYATYHVSSVEYLSKYYLEIGVAIEEE